MERARVASRDGGSAPDRPAHTGNQASFLGKKLKSPFVILWDYSRSVIPISAFPSALTELGSGDWW